MSNILAAVVAASNKGFLSCAAVHALAEKTGSTPLAIGDIVNSESELRLYRCQLGLFGFGPKSEGKHKIVLAAKNPSPEIAEAIQRVVVNGAVPCAALWAIADQFEYPRLGIANIVEALGLKVSPCQLGCF